MKSTINSQLLRRVILLGTPAATVITTIIHPNFDPANAYSALAPQVDLFLALHIVQLATFALLGLVVYLLLDGAQGLAADLSRIALAVFVVLYPAFDAAEGIGTAVLIQYAKSVPPDQLPAFSKAISTFFQNNVINALGFVGSAAWCAAVLAAAVALARPARRGVPFALILIAAAGLVLLRIASEVIPAVIGGWWADAFIAGAFLVAILFALVAPPPVSSALLVLAAIFFAASHVAPAGTVGMAALLLAVVYLEFFSRRTSAAEPSAPAPTPASS